MRALLIFSICILSQFVLAQRNIVFLELGGQGGFTSLNYELKLAKKKSGISMRTGIGTTFFEFKADDSAVVSIAGCAICGITIGAPRVSLTFPVAIQYLHNIKNKNYLEMGLGATWQLSTNPILVHHASVGFRRFFGHEKRWLWKINFTPLLGVSGKNVQKKSESTVWGGIALGRRF